MKLGQLQEEISKATLPVTTNLMNSDANVTYQTVSYLVLTNVLSTSFLMLYITFNEITTTLIDVLDTCRAMICSYFVATFLPFFMKIEDPVYTSLQNSTLLFINGLIFDINVTTT